MSAASAMGSMTVQQWKKIVPAPVRRYVRALKRGWMARRSRRTVFRASTRDARRFAQHAMTTRAELSRSNMEALLLMSAHSIEKGLSLARPRPLFGLPTIRLLMVTTEEYVGQFGVDWVVACVVATMRAYLGFHRDLTDPAIRRLRAWLDANAGWNGSVEAGVRVCRGDDLRRGGQIPDTFFLSRYSVRDFSDRRVERELLEKAFQLALKAPSVCNRQAWRVHCIRDPGLLEAIQRIAGGARGFGERAGALLMVTNDLSCFHGASERHQAWVDGGIYAMALLYALHAQGLATCCLNCCLRPAEEVEVRRLLHLPDSEVLIARIAVGHYPDTFRAAVSPRRSLDAVVRWHELPPSTLVDHPS